MIDNQKQEQEFDIISFFIFYQEIIDFKKKMLEFFNIDVSKDVNILCMSTSLLTMHPILDTPVFMDILYERHGSELSLLDTVKKYYGDDAYKWFVEHLTKPERYKKSV